MIGRYYILQGRSIRAADLMTWANAFEKRKPIARTTIGGVKISTVFLGLDHSWGDGPPLLFETMVFDGWYHHHQERCATYDEAEALHAANVKMVQRLRWIPREIQNTARTVFDAARDFRWRMRRAFISLWARL